MKFRKVKFSDVVVGEEGLLKGPFGSDLKKSLYVPKGLNTYKVYLQENILKQNISKGGHYITKDYFENNMSRYEVKEGDFIVTCDGTLGEIFQLKGLTEKGIISSSLLRITLNTKVIDQIYFPYLWRHRIKHPLIRSHENSVLKHLPGLNAIRNFEFEIPEITVQKRISDALSALDSKIELNNRINTELEAMAKTIYDYWFVQFDFPDKNGKPYKSSGGKMVWNKELKRDIPEGWDVKFLSDWIEKDKSGDWGKESEEGNYSERVHCIRGADINGLNGKGEIKSPVRYILPKNSHKILEPFDLIIEISGGSPTQSTGRLAFLMDETLSRFDAPVICSNFCKAVTLKEQNSIFNFVFEWNNAYNNGILFGFEGKTSGIKNLLFESFVNSYKTPVPPIKLMTHFFNTVISFEIKKQKGLKENNELASLRDWLLPMLMNGQVKVN
jgi:type I restriction enzyme S subunit